MAGDWSMLPLDILIAIVMKLETLEDFNYFSAVCRWWSCAPPLVKNNWKPVMPWLLLAENTKDNPDCLRKIFTFGNTNCLKPKLPETFRARCWGSPYGWVAMIDTDLNILLFNPITKARLCFPHWKTLPYSPEGNSNNYNLQCYTTKLFVLKVHRNGHHEFVIAILYCGGMELALARHDDLSWMPVSLPKGTGVMVSDIISIDDNIYALYNDASIQYWNLKEIGSENLVKPMACILGNNRSFEAPKDVRDGIRKMYLVQSGFGGHDMGVYDLKSAQIFPFYEGDCIRSSFCPATFFMTQKS